MIIERASKRLRVGAHGDSGRSRPPAAHEHGGGAEVPRERERGKKRVKTRGHGGAMRDHGGAMSSGGADVAGGRLGWEKGKGREERKP